MGEMTRMTMSDGAEVAVYHARSNGERRGGLVLIQEIFGVTDHIRELCDEYAGDGYEVLAPALFDREHPGFEAGYTGPDFDRAIELARQLHPFELSMKDTQTCIDALKDKGPVFVVGYCYGGSVAVADDDAAIGRGSGFRLLRQFDPAIRRRGTEGPCDRTFRPSRPRHLDGGRRKGRGQGVAQGGDLCLRSGAWVQFRPAQGLSRGIGGIGKGAHPALFRANGG